MPTRMTVLCLLLLGCIMLSDHVDCRSQVLLGDLGSRLGFTGMHTLDNGSTFIVAGRNYICSINSSATEKNQTVIQNVTTGPSKDTLRDDTTVAMIYSHETKRLVTCGSSRDRCDVRNVYNISDSVAMLSFSITTRETASIISRYGSENVMFVARPHTTIKHISERHKDAGLFWYKLNNFFNQTIDEESIKFKFKDDVVTVNTTKFISAFSKDTFRLFFSQQFVINERKYVSRVAQICQRADKDARLTYVDMPLECEDFRQLEVVEFIRDIGLIVAAFSRDSDSAICLYTFIDIKQKFVDNIKLCYENKLSLSNDYLSSTSRPCTKGSVTIPDKGEDYFLCNEDTLDTVSNVIGDKPLQASPVYVYNSTTITALAYTKVSSRPVLFIGTAEGKILKEALYPSSKTASYQYTVERGYPVSRDMFVINNFVYALTENRLTKVPVEMCANYKTCAECMESMDPHCGWCMLENRCTGPEDCKTSDRTEVSGNASSCPSVRSTTPQVLRTDRTHQLELLLSHDLSRFNVTCSFLVTENGLHIPLNSSHGEVTNHSLKCLSPDVKQKLFALEGESNITIQVLTNVSSLPVMEGNVTVYKCENFKSCLKCTMIRWNCSWCPLQGRCVRRNEQCSESPNFDDQVITAKDFCPLVTNYTVENNNVTDSNTTTMYLSVQQVYEVKVTGERFTRPSDGTNYNCSVSTPSDPHPVSMFPATFQSSSCIKCSINQMRFPRGLSQHLSVTLNSVKLDGRSIEVVFYRCEDLIGPNNCKQCDSLSVYQPYFRCHWCERQCRHVGGASQCGNPGVCPPPNITRVYPLFAHVNASLWLEIEGVNLATSYEEANGSVMLGNKSCHFQRNNSYCNSAYAGNCMSCELTFYAGPERTAVISLQLPGHSKVTFSEPFTFQIPEIHSVEPNFGPVSGRTNITIAGRHLLTGRHQTIRLGRRQCANIDKHNDTYFSCRTDTVPAVENVTVELIVDNQSVKNLSVNFSYVSDPVVSQIQPRTSFHSGGRQLTVTGMHLLAVMKPMIVGHWNNGTHEYTIGLAPCTRQASPDGSLNGTLLCPSPTLNNSVYQSESRMTRSMQPDDSISLGLLMDGVGSVVNLQPDIGTILYYPDPTLYHFKEVQTPNRTLEIKGENLLYASTKEDIEVTIGCLPCNVTDMSHVYIRCNPPSQRPHCGNPDVFMFQIQVKIGFLRRVVGEVQYSVEEPLGLHDNNHNMPLYLGCAVGGAVLLCLVLVLICYIIRYKGRIQQRMAKDKKSYEYKMDKMEATFRNQCREEFAALQTTMDDLTADLEGGSVLFRDYNEYACRTLLTAEKSRCLLSPPTSTSEKIDREMEQLRNLFRIRQFLLLFIRTLEKQKSFTIQDKSNVATFLMVINHDNMEYITGILTSLLNDLIDKNITANTPKLLLRSSESIGEKLLAHWLSIGLYHYLKEQTGSELFILYKAIKIQVEKGPVDYITACAKFTLSEDKLFTDTDKDDPKQLKLEVTHFDYLENKQKVIEVMVLDCDTVTQAKSKMLEILYKNIGYSMRPPVHTTVLEVTLGNGSKVQLHDEDSSSKRDGFWRRINTMRHFGIPNGATASLYFNREDLTSSVTVKSAEAPDAYIVGSIKKSKPVVRTISGSKFWHMMKQEQDDDEVRLSTDLFLPRLIKTKGTLQEYIDNFYKSILHMSAEPPIIVKYLFDLLDASAARCSITDPEVIHTWKCNSLLLRFWVNVIKNPEFVFDIPKPVIVDSCLSVVAQTLMDSCSTADLRLSATSPSNKLLFAKDIPRYKKMVAEYFREMQSRPSVSDMDLNSFLKEKVSQKYGAKLNQSTALHEMYTFVNRYRDKICAEMDNAEAEHPGTFAALSSRLQCIYMTMDQLAGSY